MSQHGSGDTRPPAIIADANRFAAEMKSKAGNDADWRIAQAEFAGFARATLEYLVDADAQHKQWQRNHQDKDDTQFAQIRRSLGKKIAVVSASVDDLESNQDKVKGAWRLATVGAAVLLAAGGLGAWIIDKLIEVLSK